MGAAGAAGVALTPGELLLLVFKKSSARPIDFNVIIPADPNGEFALDRQAGEGTRVQHGARRVDFSGEHMPEHRAIQPQLALHDLAHASDFVAGDSFAPYLPKARNFHLEGIGLIDGHRKRVASKEAARLPPVVVSQLTPSKVPQVHVSIVRNSWTTVPESAIHV